MNLNLISNNNLNIKKIIPFKAQNNFGQQNKLNQNKDNNNLLPFTLATAALSATVIAGITIASGKNKIPPEVSSIIKVSQEFEVSAATTAKEILAFSKSVREKFNSVCALFKNGGIDTNSDRTVKIINAKDGIISSIMEEYNPDGSLFRKSSFSLTKNPVKIEEFLENGKKNILEYDWLEGNCTKYIEGYKKASNGDILIDKQLKTGKNFLPETYFENYRKFSNGDSTADIQVGFHTNGSIREYFEKYSINGEGNISIGKGIFFDHCGVNMYVSDNKIIDGLETVGQELDFKHGKPVQCTIKSREISEGEVVFEHRFMSDSKSEEWVEVKS